MMLSSFFAAIRGTFYAQLVGFITPTRTMSVDFSVQMVVMAVLGGVGTVLGPVWGALVLVPIAETTRAVWGGSFQGVHLIVYGALLMVVILYWPQGIDPWVRRGVDALARRLRRSAAPEVAVENAPRAVLPERGLLAAPLAANGGGAVLSVRGLSRRFGGAVGVLDVTFDVAHGEVRRHHRRQRRGQDHALQPDHRGPHRRRGRDPLHGRRLDRESPHERNRLGIARTFQIVRPFIGMTALDNVVVAALPRSRDVAAARRDAERYLGFVGLSHRLHTIASGLSTGSASGSSWPGRSPRGRACSCWTRSRAGWTSAACPASSAS